VLLRYDDETNERAIAAVEITVTELDEVCFVPMAGSCPTDGGPPRIVKARPREA
jgi:hypothetical protein